MERFIEWIEDYYIYFAMIFVIAFFSFGGIVSYCEKKDDGESEKWSLVKQIEENRTEFYEKYEELLPQFLTARDFSLWLDGADHESIVLLHSLIGTYSDEYDGDEGFADMVDYLHWTEPESHYE